MAKLPFRWQAIGLFGFFALMTFGAFAQSAQPSEAHYMTPRMCEQLWKACEHQTEMGIRSRACSMHATLCEGWTMSSSSSDASCGPSAILCPPNRMPACANGRWRCVTASSSSSASSVLTGSCATTQVLCIAGTMPHCINDQWQCLPSGSSSSVSSDACIARCPDGYQYRTCTEDGHPINYFADPCMGHYASSSSSSLSSAQLCDENLCGPQMGMPNWICPDGQSYGGPSGRCIKHANGACGWEVLSCPATSSVSSSSSSSSLGMGCYCTRIYKPVCGTNGQTYGNECEAGCANVGVAHEGRCMASSSSSAFSAIQIDRCPVYSLMAPGPGCRYVYEKDAKGCDVPRLVCRGSSSSRTSSSSSSSSVQSVGATGGCKVGGCSGQLCVEEGSDGISTCEWREEYACYRTARCERQATGVCGWTQTQELRSCIANSR